MPTQPNLKEYESEFLEIYKDCKEYTMSSIERMYALYKAVEYIIYNNIEGDFVECGVWRGGSAMIIAKTLLKLGVSNRTIFLYDTFEGMTPPKEYDISLSGESAISVLKNTKKEIKPDKESIWCIADINDVTKNLYSTKYPMSNIKLVKGDVANTLLNSSFILDIALLRLDTDWYESTKLEMEVLFPKLVKSGVLIIDDYGHWLGARKAVDEYFSSKNLFYLIQRIDYTGRIIVKT